MYKNRKKYHYFSEKIPQHTTTPRGKRVHSKTFFNDITPSLFLYPRQYPVPEIQVNFPAIHPPFNP